MPEQPPAASSIPWVKTRVRSSHLNLTCRLTLVYSTFWLDEFGHILRTSTGYRAQCEYRPNYPGLVPGCEAQKGCNDGPPSIVATSANNHSLASHWQQFFSGFFLVTKSKFLSLLTATIHFNGPRYTEYPFVLLEQRGLVRNTKPLKGSKAVFNMELANNITISGSPASVCVHFVEQSLENVTASYGLTFLQLSGIINCSSQAQQKLTCQVW